GVGEVTPLPGFHQESLEDARVQLRIVLPLLLCRVASVDLAALDDGIDAWLSAALVDHHHPTQAAMTTLLPSVRCGIEMALVHLVARASGVSI
ncbi:unnamed protein product, partial [Laminaria digitata]